MTEKRQADNKKKKSRNNVRPTVGLLTGGISGELGTSFLAGVANAAEEQDVNLITFPGESLRSPYGFEAQANVLYNLATAGVVDGLVIDGGLLSHSVGPEALQDFRARYDDLPVVSVEVPLEDDLSVLTNFYQGMHRVMTHLIEEHGYRRIAFIRGPEESPTGEERYRAYQDALAEHDIPLDMALVAPGTFFAPSGEEAVRLLLDERKVKFEAVAAANDFMAVDVVQALQARGIQVPADVAVTGFDNFGVARAVTPPLTTAQLGNYERAQQATTMLLAQLGEKAISEPVVRPVELVVRQSCGCPALAVVEAAAGAVEATDETVAVVLTKQREQILIEMGQAMRFSGGQAGWWAEQLLDALSAELSGESTGAFLSVLAEVLSRVAATGGDPAAGSGQSVIVWQRALSVLRRYVVSSLGSQEVFARAEDLWQQARVMIGERAERIELYRNLESEQRSEMLRQVGQLLITTHDVAELMDTLVQQLPRLGISSCYLSLYVDPNSPAEWARLVLAYREGERVVLAEEKKRFASPQLVPEGLLSEDRRYQFIVEPLYFRENQIGFALFEFEQGTPQVGLISEALRGQLSIALQGALLMQQEEKRARQLQTVAQVSTAALNILDTTELLQTVVDLTKASFGLYHAHIYLLDDIKSDLVLTAGAGEIGQKMVAQGWRIPVGREQSLVARAARTRTGFFVNNVRDEPGWLANKDLPDTRSELAVPLLVGDRVLGVLDVQSDEIDHFTTDDIRIQITLAAQVAVALENARLFEQAERTDFLLRERVKELDCLNDIGREMEENPPPLPQLLEWITRRILPAMQHPNLTVAAIEFDGNIYGNPEAINLPTQIVHGLHIGGQVLGRIYIAYTEPASFIDEESALLGGIATRLSSFIENQRLLDQMQERAHELEETTHFLDSVVENIPVMLFVKDAKELRFVRWNKAGEELIGITNEEMVGKNDYDLFPKEEADFFTAKDREVLAGGELVDIPEEPIETGKGTRLLHTTKIPIYGLDGEPKYLLGISEDITGRKRVAEEQEQLLAEVRQLAAIVENHPDFIGVGSLQGNALYVNPAGLKMMGLPPDHDVTTMDASDFFTAEDAEKFIKEGVSTALGQGSWSAEANLLRADGKIVPVELTVSVNYDTKGNPTTLSVTMHDITNRQVAAIEQARLLAEVEASYRQYVRQEWEQYLQEQYRGRWHIEHNQLESWEKPNSQRLSQLQEEVMRQQKTRVVSNSSPNDDTYPESGLTPPEPALIVAPISLRGQVIGTLNLQDTLPNRNWTSEEVALVEAVSEQLALTVENLRLFDDTGRRAGREQIIADATRQIWASGEIEQVMRTAVEQLGKTLDASRVIIRLGTADRLLTPNGGDDLA
jgi:PAS domain S-box-containing protein